MPRQLSDEELVPLIAGCLSALAANPAFPIQVREINRLNAEDGQGTGFEIVTASGLSYVVNVSFAGEKEN